MKIEDIRFNFIYENDKSIRYIKGRTPCEVLSFKEIIQKQRELRLSSYNKSLTEEKNQEIKEKLPALQIFTDGIRSVKDTNGYNFIEWNKVICIDIDTKQYKGEKKIKWNALEQALLEQLKTIYYSNFVCIQRSYSNTSWHVFFAYSCIPNEETFKKLAKYSTHCVRTIFYNLGLNDVIDYPKVIDNCMDKPTQPIFVSGNPFLMNDYGFDGKYSDEVIDYVTDESLTNEVVRSNDITIFHSNLISLDTNNIACFSKDFIFNHNILWRIVNICTRVHKDFDEFYKWICWFIDNITCELDRNRTKEFYKREQYLRSLWDSLCKSNTSINMTLLRLLCQDFGWTYKYDMPELPNDNKYVYQKMLEKNWTKYVHNLVINKYINEVFTKSPDFESSLSAYCSENNITSAAGRTEFIDNKKEELRNNTTVDSEIFDECSKINYWRMKSNKKIFDWKKDKHICGIEKFDENDTMTYKMFADLYYRDNDGNNTIRYNVIDDDIELYSYDKQEGYVCWHKFKYEDERNIWTSAGVFSTKCKKELLWTSIDEYVPDFYRYDPIKDYLNHFEYTEPTEKEINQLETFFIRHIQADDTELNRAITKNWLVAAVKKRLHNKDFVFPHILMLRGDTNNNKSYSICKLFTIYGHDYTVNDINTNDSDSKMGPLLQSNWCIQFGERKGISKIDNNANKEFVDRINTSLKYQKKFKNEVTIVKPKVVCVITTNDKKLYNDYNVDSDKRFWLIECNAPAYSSTIENRKLIADEIDDIWRIAVNIYRQNNDIDLEFDGKLVSQMKEIQKKYMTLNEEEIKESLFEMLNRKYNVNFHNGRTYFDSLNDYVEQLNNYVEKFNSANINCLPVRYLNKWKELNKYDSRHSVIIERILEENGWTKKNIRFVDSNPKCWYNPNIVQTTAYGESSIIIT